MSTWNLTRWIMNKLISSAVLAAMLGAANAEGLDDWLSRIRNLKTEIEKHNETINELSLKMSQLGNEMGTAGRSFDWNRMSKLGSQMNEVGVRMGELNNQIHDLSEQMRESLVKVHGVSCKSGKGYLSINFDDKISRVSCYADSTEIINTDIMFANFDFGLLPGRTSDEVTITDKDHLIIGSGFEGEFTSDEDTMEIGCSNNEKPIKVVKRGGKAICSPNVSVGVPISPSFYRNH